MSWPTYLERVTVVDVLDSGVCYEGVRDWVRRHRGIIAGDTQSQIENEYVARAANADGYDDGYGYGYGYGDGYGDGDGSGFGSGSGFGFG